MRGPVHLWIMTVQAPIAVAESLSELFSEEAVSLAVMAPPRQETAVVEAIFDHEPIISEINARLAVFSMIHGLSQLSPEVKPTPPLDWLKKVAEGFPPLRIARWTVHGAMHRDKVPVRSYALQIDATNAFGTGEHPTTRGCLILLDRVLKRGFRPRRMADIGCGSGILAMAAVQVSRGFGVGVDLDPDSVEIARGNIRGNGLSHRIQVGRSRGYAASIVRRHAPYDLIMANIFARPLSQLAWNLKNHLKPGGIAILSGLLTSQANLVISSHRMQGLSLMEHMKIGEWSILALGRVRQAR